MVKHPEGASGSASPEMILEKLAQMAEYQTLSKKERRVVNERANTIFNTFAAAVAALSGGKGKVETTAEEFEARMQILAQTLTIKTNLERKYGKLSQKEVVALNIYTAKVAACFYADIIGVPLKIDLIERNTPDASLKSIENSKTVIDLYTIQEYVNLSLPEMKKIKERAGILTNTLLASLNLILSDKELTQEREQLVTHDMLLFLMNLIQDALFAGIAVERYEKKISSKEQKILLEYLLKLISRTYNDLVIGTKH